MLLVFTLASIVLIAIAVARFGRSTQLAWIVLGIAILTSALYGVVYWSESALEQDSSAGLAKALSALVLIIVAAAMSGAQPRLIVAFALPAMALVVLYVGVNSGRAIGWTRIGFWGMLAAYLCHCALLSNQGRQTNTGTIFSLAIWFALATSLVEIGWRAVRLWLLTPMRVLESQDSLVYLSRDAFWAGPAGNIFVFVILAVILSGIRFFRQDLVTVPVAVFWYSWTASFAVFQNVLEWLWPTFMLIYSLAMAFGLQFRIVKSFDTFNLWTRRTQPIFAGIIVVMILLVPVRDRLRENRQISALPQANSGLPNVLLIVMDTARQASFGAFNSSRPVTPNLDRFASRGVVFEHAITNSSWTLPSHASMFTGRWCHEHRAGFIEPVSPDYATLAESLSANGYETAGFVANTGFCGRHTGLARGFQRYNDHPSAVEMLRLNSLVTQIVLWQPNWVIRPAKEFVDETLEWLDQRDDSRPFFAFLNLLDPHFPYRVQDARFDEFTELPLRRREEIRRRWAQYPESYLPNTPDEIQFALDTYDGSIKYLDHHIGRLLDELDRKGILQNTLVILTNDHGEHFGEKGLFLHGTSLYRPLIDAPLIVLFPEGEHAAERNSSPVGLQMLPKTILTYLGLPEAERFPGRSLTDCWDAQGTIRPLTAGPVISQLGEAFNIEGQMNSDSVVYSVVADGFQYIHAQRGLREEIYSFRDDRWNEHNLIATSEGRQAASRLRAILEQALDPKTGQAVANQNEPDHRAVSKSN